MDIQGNIDLIANILAITIILVKACKDGKPWVKLRAQSLWQRARHEVAADIAAARAAPLWRKAAGSLFLLYSLGATSAYLAMANAPPWWAEVWGASLAPLLMAYGGWLAIRWAVRRRTA